MTGNDRADDLMIGKTMVMLEMQDRMNMRVDPDWRQRNREWYRAIWIECAELMDHYGGWKWWKASSPNVEQAMLEIVDIWHFGLSLRIVAEPRYSSAAKRIVTDWRASAPIEDFLSGVEQVALVALVEQEFVVGCVRQLLVTLDKNYNDLYCAYIGKNVLNFFRQDHGYREGNYQKVWGGREDNEHLVELMRELDSDDLGFRDSLYAELTARHARLGS